MANTPATNRFVHLLGEYRPIRSNLRLIVTVAQSTDTCASSKTEDPSASIESSGLVVSCGNSKRRFVLEDLQLPETNLPPFSDGQVEVTLHTSRQEWLCLQAGQQQSGTSQARLVEQVRGSQGDWQCAACGQCLLLSDRKFERVLPLPSDLWSEQSQLWFCHTQDETGASDHSCSESNTVGSSRPSLLSPRSSDCLVSPLYLFLPLAFLRPGAVESRGKDLHCLQCGEFLGATEAAAGGTGNEGAMKLYTCCVKLPGKGPQTHSFQAESSDRWSPSRLERFFHDFLKEQSELYTSFRFLLQPPGPDFVQSAVLVWLMDPNLVIFTATDELSEEENTKLVRRRSALQLLYLTASHCKEEDDWRKLRAQWSADTAVHTVAMAAPLCGQLAATLDRGNGRLSELHQQAKDFRVCILQQNSGGGSPE